MRILGFTRDQDIRENARNSLIDGMLYSAMVGLTNPFFGILAVKLGATDFQLGLLTSLPALLSLLAMIPGAIIVGRYRSPLPCVVRYAAMHRVGFLALAALPWLAVSPWAKGPGFSVALLFIIILSLMNFPAAVAGVAWTSLMGDLFPADIRGQVFGERNMLTGLVSLLGTMVAGYVLGSVGFPWNYSLLFVASFAFTMGSLYYLTRLREPLEEPLDASRVVTMAAAASPAGGVVRSLLQVFTNRSFTGFAWGAFIMHVGMNLPVSIWTILFVRQLHLSEEWIGAFATIAGATSMVSYPLWGRLADRRGNRWVFLVSCLGFVPLPFLYSFVRSPVPIIFLQIAAGLAGAGFTLALFNRLLELAPESRRADYIGVFNTLMGLTGFLMPVIGVWVYTLAGMRTVFAASSLIRVAAVWVLAGAPLASRAARAATSRRGRGPTTPAA